MRHILLAATALAMLGGAAYAQNSQSSPDQCDREHGIRFTVTIGLQSAGERDRQPDRQRRLVQQLGCQGDRQHPVGLEAAAVGNRTIVTVTGYAGRRLRQQHRSGGGTAPAAATPHQQAGSSGNLSPARPGGNDDLNYSGSYTIRNTPEVIAPSVVGGNPCAVGASGGVSLPGFGLALGGTWADKACERRQQAALLFNMGENKVAVELMCQDDNVRSAMKTGGKACAADIAVAQVPAPVVALPDPAAPVVLMAAQMPALPKPEWCARAAPSTEASKAYVAQLCGR